jgi:hypothetical protein
MKAQRMLVGGLMVAVFVTCFALGTVHAQPGEYPDLRAWANDTWFKVKLTVTTYHFDGVGLKPKPSAPVPQKMGTAYINIHNWSAGSPDNPPTLTADIWAKEDGGWVPFFPNLVITYFAGSDLKFIGSAQLEISDDVTMHLIFVFTGSKYTRGDKAGQFKLGGVTKLSTIGGSILEIDDAEDAPDDPLLKERWAGSATISGPMVPEPSLLLPATP